MNTDDTRRRIFGALLGGTFWAAVGLGLSGFWDWVYLFGVPVHHRPRAFVGLGIGGLAGIAWGLLAAWPRRWRVGVLLNTAVTGVLVSLPALYDLIRHPEMWDYELLLGFALAPLAITVLLDLLLASLLRGVLRLALQRWRQAKYPSLSVFVPLLIALGLALTWPLDQLDESIGGRRAALRKVHRYGQAQGWEGYTVELEAMDSAYAIIRVHMSDGEVYTCHASPWEDITLGDITLWGVTCQP